MRPTWKCACRVKTIPTTRRRRAMTHPVPRIAITPGEPAGIGPELCAHLLNHSYDAELVLVADAKLLHVRAGFHGPAYEPEDDAVSRALRLQHYPLRTPARAGRLDALNAGYVLGTLSAACDGCLDGHFDALVTGPVHKGVINQAGYGFTGHTEYLARRCGGQPVMMLAAPGLRVALATTHLPLARVSEMLTQERLELICRTLHQDMRSRFGLERPRILVCGLNPHAGEGGHFGHEEREVIEPVLRRLRGEDMDLRGPLPADTAFTPRYLEIADAVLAMYHDQGLPVLKHMGFGHAVNVTLGLPIIRTSVDHGTALDLAGSGKAYPGSLHAAIETALQMTNRTRNAE